VDIRHRADAAAIVFIAWVVEPLRARKSEVRHVSLLTRRLNVRSDRAPIWLHGDAKFLFLK